MIPAPEIQYIQSIRKYQLNLPAAIIEAFQLNDETGKPLTITHENKMEVEWLAQKLNTQFISQIEAMKTFRTKLSRKKKIAFIFLAVAILITVFSYSISKLIGSTQILVSAFGFTIAIVALLQLLKYIAQGLSGPMSKLTDPEETSKIKEIILRNFVS